MSRRGKVLAVTGLALLILLLAFGCSLFLKGDINAGEQTGWYIKLNIHGPSSSKAITVSEYQVTGLDIVVKDPGGVDIKTIAWQAAEGSSSYVIPVTQQGLHKILVTHKGSKDGQVVQAEESATFNIKAMVITAIDITPGCIGVIDVEGGGAQPGGGLFGHWFASHVGQPGGPQNSDIDCTIRADGSFQSLLYDTGSATLQQMSMRGTYTLDDGVFNAVSSEIYMQGSGWVPMVMNYSATYTLSGDTFTLHQDFNQDGIPDMDWVLSRVQNELSLWGTWINPFYVSGPQGPPGKIEFNVNGSTAWYTLTTDLGPYDSGTYQIDYQLNNLYKVFFAGASSPTGNYFLLFQVSSDGATLEGNVDFAAYPPSINPADPNMYFTFSRL